MARPVTPTRAPRFFLLAFICVVVAALYFARDVLIPLSLAILFSFMLAPSVRQLERWKVPRVASVIIVVSVALALIGMLGYLVYTQVVALATELPTYRQNIEQKISQIRPGKEGMFAKVQEAAEQLSKVAEAPATQATQPTTATATELAQNAATRMASGTGPPPSTTLPEAISRPAGTSSNPIWVVPRDPPATPLRLLQQYIARALAPLGMAGVVIVFVIFMLLAREDMRDRLIRLIGQGRLSVTTQALDDAAKRISRYLMAQAIVNGTYGIAIALGLWLIGVPSPALWGLLCALLRFVPYVGPWIAAAFPLMLSLASFEGFVPFIETAILFVVIELLSNNAMEPWLYGSSTGMSTIAVLVAAVFWTWLWGPIGLVMSTPLTACLVVAGKYVPQLQFLDILLGDEPVLSPPERVYQRLLAGDEEETSELVNQYLEKQSLEEVYDEVLLPALAMAEQDRHSDRLDETRWRFIRQTMRQFVEELSDSEKLKEVRRAADRSIADAKGETGTTEAPPGSRPLLPSDCVIKVICLPAHDEADEIAGMMLAQLLELRGYCTRNISQNALASEMLDQVEREAHDLVCVSALPPAAVSHARYLCKRLHARLPEISTVVGLWTVKGDLKRAQARILCSHSVQFATTLAKAIEQIQQHAHSAVVQNNPSGNSDRR